MCDSQWAGICWVEAGSSTESIFGFSSFLSALAILFVLYTVAGERFKFRIAVAPVPLHTLSFWIVGVIGICVLISEVWVNQAWLTPDWNLTQSAWQGLLGFTFFLLISFWMWFGFIRPPMYSRFNSSRFASEVYRYSIEGKDAASSEIMYEISNSIKEIIEAASSIEEGVKPTSYQAYAHDILLMLGDKRLCKVAANSHPLFIIRLFDSLNTKNISKVPIYDVTRNISTALILSKESLLSYESEFISTGLLGEIKPLSTAMFGNMNKIEKLGANWGSPLDMEYSNNRLTSFQLETYCRCLTIAIGSYIKERLWIRHSYVFSRAFHFIDSETHGLHEINLNPDGFHELEVYKRFQVVAKFLSTTVISLDEKENISEIVTYSRENRPQHPAVSEDIFDFLADLAFKMSHTAAYVNSDSDTCWWIQHNILWAPLVSDFREGPARNLVLDRYFYLIEKEIFWKDGFLTYKSARLLGFVLNMLGVSTDANTEGKYYHQFRINILDWTKRNYELVRKNQIDVANTVLFGSITYEDGYLVKTYAKGLGNEAPYELLELSKA
ncbi:hypothetical protein N5M11_000221 [Vibrio alginolyticus]|nr:hypothetical protein [Vibrio alginolyticus]